MKIISATCSYRKEPLVNSFGFKGGYLTELWQVETHIVVDQIKGTGLGVQSVLWSDSDLFSTNSEEQGNKYMFQLTKYACERLVGLEFTNPIALIDYIFPIVKNYALALTNIKDNLKDTFIRNALVSIDNSLWQIYSKILGKDNFLEIIPKEYRCCLMNKHKKLLNVPLISYNVDINFIKKLLTDGCEVLKIKIGFDNNGKLTKEEMIDWDIKRIRFIHNICKNFKARHSKSHHILYYLDANGKYETKDQLRFLISALEKEGILERVILFEEPFNENADIDISDFNIRFAIDESAHSLDHVINKIKFGYKAIALKPIAKTLSETLKILKYAHENNVLCFCADLTVNPTLVLWNMNIASRIDVLPELDIGIIESNGNQNYVNWNKMLSSLKNPNYLLQNNGVYYLDSDFFIHSGYIFSE